MNYSLGNIISNGGAINPDGLALDLAFAADKTLTARRGPTPTFSRASTATFVGSNGLIQSAAINAPRFDHNPVTLASRGLLIEEQRTNALQHSANFKNTTSSYWENRSATTVTVDQIASPDGGVNADLLTTSTVSFDCFARRNGIFVGSTQYSYSIFVKQGPSLHRYVGLYIGVGVGSLSFPFFDFNNPTTVQIPSGTMVGTINSTRVDAYPNGWYRVSVTFTTAETPPSSFCGVYISSSNGDLPSTSVAGLDAYIWGIQLELGSFPTSYIPTTTTALTRSADVCSITGADFTRFYNQSEGTLTSQAMIANLVGANRSIVQIDDGTNLNILRHFYDNIFRSVVRASGDVSTELSNVVGTALVIQKRALAYQGTSFASTTNGLAVESATRAAPVGLNAFRIGTFTGGFQLNGHIASIQYFRKRLPNAKLQSLTA